MLGGKKVFVQKSRAQFERWWLTVDEKKKHPLESAVGRIRIDRTLSLISKKSPSSIIDVGSGDGTLAKRLDQLGHQVLCVDVASHALNHLESLDHQRGCFPYLDAIDSQFDIVLCADLIAELPTTLHRLGISTLATLVKSTGSVILSTPLDTSSYDAFELFLSLVSTEFEIESIVTSHHRLFLALLNCLKGAQKRLKALHNPEYRDKKGYSLWALRLLNPFCLFVHRPLSFLAHQLENSERALLFFEKITQFLLPQGGRSHVICLCRRRKLF